ANLPTSAESGCGMWAGGRLYDDDGDIGAGQLGATQPRLPPGRRDQMKSLCCGSAECERKRLHARIEKLDLKLAIRDGHRVSDQLIEPLFGNRAVAPVVNVTAVRSARGLSINAHAETGMGAWHSRPHDEVQITSVEAVD